MMHISNRTRTGGGCIRFNYMKKAVRKGGVSYPEFQILQLRRYLRYICTFLMVWGTFHLPLINQCKTQTSCSSKKRRKYLQNISFFFCNVCNLRLNASVAAFLIVFPTAALEAPFSIYLQPESIKLFRGATLNTVYRKYSPVFLTKGIESNIW